MLNGVYESFEGKSIVTSIITSKQLGLLNNLPPSFFSGLDTYIWNRDYPELPDWVNVEIHEPDINFPHEAKECGYSNSTLCYNCDSIVGGSECAVCVVCVPNHVHWKIRDDNCDEHQ